MRFGQVGKSLVLATGVAAAMVVTSADAFAGGRGYYGGYHGGYRGGYGYGYRGYGCCSSGQWAAIGLGAAALGGLAYLSTQRSYAPAYYAPPAYYYPPPYYYAPPAAYYPPPAYYAPAPVPTYYAPSAYAPATTYYAPQSVAAPAAPQAYAAAPGTTNYYYAPQPPAGAGYTNAPPPPAASYATVVDTPAPAPANQGLPTYYTAPAAAMPAANPPAYNPYAERERLAQQSAGGAQ